MNDLEDRIPEALAEAKRRWGENGHVFLAAVSWAVDSLEQERGLPKEPSWKAFATFLYCGKIYE
jgi:hypothetical protein